MSKRRSNFLSTPTNDYDLNENDFDKLDDNYSIDTKETASPSSRSKYDEEEDLVMDVLPEATRFTTLVSINKINVDLIDDDHLNEITIPRKY